MQLSLGSGRFPLTGVFSRSIALPCALPHSPPLDVEIAPCASPGNTMSNPTHDPFYSSPFGPFYRRHSPYMVQPEYRIYEMNKRLQARTEVRGNGRRWKARSGLGLRARACSLMKVRWRDTGRGVVVGLRR